MYRERVTESESDRARERKGESEGRERDREGERLRQRADCDRETYPSRYCPSQCSTKLTGMNTVNEVGWSSARWIERLCKSKLRRSVGMAVCIDHAISVCLSVSLSLSLSLSLSADSRPSRDCRDGLAVKSPVTPVTRTAL